MLAGKTGRQSCAPVFQPNALPRGRQINPATGGMPMNPEDIKHLHPKLAPDAPDPIETRATAPQNLPDDPHLDLIAEAHTRVLDTVSGFRKVVEKAQPEFRPVADAFLAMHVRHEGELAAHLRKCGREPGEDGSFFGTVNRAVIEMRSWFEDVTESIMDRVAQGELHVLDAYKAARDAGQNPDTDLLLTRHMAEIDALMRKHTP
jgi:hypothetical protein